MMKSEVLAQLQWRYACKKFDNTRQLSKDQLAVVKQAFDLTATSYGLQPLKMVVVQDQSLKEKLVAATMNQQQVRQSSAVLVICIENILDKDFVDGYFDLIRKIRQTPEKILAPFQAHMVSEICGMSQGERVQWMTKQAYIALGNILAVCAIEGIDACPMEGFYPDQYTNVLGLDPLNVTPVLVVPIGFRAPDDPFASFAKVRRGIDQVVIDL
ncbi:MAG: nitroreductase family protein [Flavobacteriaceae bacterium]|nr:nitroreductase family protein [Flavobacteriaceae bacterium]MDG1961830.1 nitroreductase family protein [Flavobacteriaceae bacterium]